VGKSSTRKKQKSETAKGTLTSPPRESRYASYLRASPLKVYLHLLIIVVVGVIAYSNTFHVPFALDDKKHIMNNLMLRNLENFWLALRGQHFSSGGYHYLPSRFLGYLSFALNYHFGGFGVWGYHLANLVIHIVNALLVYLFVKLTFQTPKMRNGDPLSSASDAGVWGSAPVVALFTALLFVAHPVQTQAVTYVVQRFASLATMFYLLSLVMYIRGRLGAMGNWQEAPPLNPPLVRGEVKGGHSPIPSRLWPIAYYSFSLLFAVCAMKTKEISFTLPIVIILYEFVFFATPLKKKLLFLLPVVLTIVIVPLSIMHSGKPIGEILSDVSEMTRVQTQIPRGDYLMTEMRVITTYIRLIFVPVNQNLDYDYPIYHSLFTPAVFLSFLFLSGLFGTAVYLLYKSRQGARGYGQEAQDTPQGEEPKTGSSPLASDLSPIACQRLIAFGILWFFITLSVESSVIPIADVIFEHRVYLPSVGFFTAIATGVFLVAARLKREKSMIPIVVVITLALSATTYARTNVWRDEAGFWEDVVKKSPNKARPRNNLGIIYYKTGHLDKAVKELEIAIRLAPGIDDTHCNLGVVYNAQNRLSKAIVELRAALRLNPDNAEARYNLGVAYHQQGRLVKAMREYQTAVRLNPDYAEAHNNLGVIYQKQGMLDKAMGEFQTALRLNSDSPTVHNNLGIVYGRQGRRDEAMREFQAALRLNPDDAAARHYIELLNK
jgi:Flp pilus assembly protein TadD